MENQFSKQDKTIEEGVQALRSMSVDTSGMSSVLNPHPKRSIALPVGMATALACAIGVTIVMSPGKAEANPFQKVKDAVLKQTTVHQRAFEKNKDGAWILEVETYQDGKQKGVKWGEAKGSYQYVIVDGKKIEKRGEVFEITALLASLDEEASEDNPTVSIHETLARDGMQFLGIRRSQKKNNRLCDVYRVNFNGEPNDQLYYVDPKTDLPFLLETVDKDGKVIDMVQLDFSGTIVIFDLESFQVKDGGKAKPTFVNGSKDLFTVEVEIPTQIEGKVSNGKAESFTIESVKPKAKSSPARN